MAEIVPSRLGRQLIDLLPNRAAITSCPRAGELAGPIFSRRSSEGWRRVQHPTVGLQRAAEAPARHPHLVTLGNVPAHQPVLGAACRLCAVAHAVAAERSGPHGVADSRREHPAHLRRRARPPYARLSSRSRSGPAVGETVLGPRPRPPQRDRSVPFPTGARDPVLGTRRPPAIAVGEQASARRRVAAAAPVPPRPRVCTGSGVSSAGGLLRGPPTAAELVAAVWLTAVGANPVRAAPLRRNVIRPARPGRGVEDTASSFWPRAPRLALADRWPGACSRTPSAASYLLRLPLSDAFVVTSGEYPSPGSAMRVPPPRAATDSTRVGSAGGCAHRRGGSATWSAETSR